MSGYMIAEIWCDRVDCDTPRLIAEDEGTLSELRQEAKRSGWIRRRRLAPNDEGKLTSQMLDICPDCVEVEEQVTTT